MKTSRVVWVLFAMVWPVFSPAVEPALMRAVGGVLDVTQPPYNADPSGGRDATQAILQAMHDAARRTPGIFTTGNRAVQIVYLPDGVYRVSAPLLFDTPAILAARPKSDSIFEHKYVSGHMMLLGQSRDGTLIKVDDHCPAFRHPSAHRIRHRHIRPFPFRRRSR